MDVESENKVALVTGSNRNTGSIIANCFANEAANICDDNNPEDIV